MTSVSFRCDQLDLRALCFYAAVLLSLLSRSRACCQCLLGERRRLCCPECESPLGRERGSGSRPVNGQRGLLGSSMLSGSSPLPHRVSAHFGARREFFKRIRDSLHCVRRTLQRGALPSHFKHSVLLAALLSPPQHNAEYGQQCTGSEKKQGKATTRQNKPLLFEFDVFAKHDLLGYSERR